MSYSQRNTRVELLLRKAREFESDGITYWVNFGAFCAMVDIKARSNNDILMQDALLSAFCKTFLCL